MKSTFTRHLCHRAVLGSSARVQDTVPGYKKLLQRSYAVPSPMTSNGQTVGLSVLIFNLQHQHLPSRTPLHGAHGDHWQPC
jgi:hypothetical protein